jgi:hypothetical protein
VKPANAKRVHGAAMRSGDMIAVAEMLSMHAYVIDYKMVICVLSKR